MVAEPEVGGLGEPVAVPEREVLAECSGCGWSDRNDSSAAALAVADMNQPVSEVDAGVQVTSLEGGDFTGPHAGLQHAPARSPRRADDEARPAQAGPVQAWISARSCLSVSGSTTGWTDLEAWGPANGSTARQPSAISQAVNRRTVRDDSGRHSTRTSSPLLHAAIAASANWRPRCEASHQATLIHSLREAVAMTFGKVSKRSSPMP